MSKIIFRDPYSEVVVPSKDFSKKTQPTFNEIEPFAKDSNGKFLNESASPKLVKGDDFNIDDYIQSFADDVDLYKIFNRCVDADTTEFMNIATPGYGDISELPETYAAMHEMVDSANKIDIQKLQAENKALKEAQAKQNEDFQKQITSIAEALAARQGGNL